MSSSHARAWPQSPGIAGLEAAAGSVTSRGNVEPSCIRSRLFPLIFSLTGVGHGTDGPDSAVCTGKTEEAPRVFTAESALLPQSPAMQLKKAILPGPVAVAQPALSRKKIAWLTTSGHWPISGIRITMTLDRVCFEGKSCLAAFCVCPARVANLFREFPKIGGTLFWGPYNLGPAARAGRRPPCPPSSCYLGCFLRP